MRIETHRCGGLIDPSDHKNKSDRWRGTIFMSKKKEPDARGCTDCVPNLRARALPHDPTCVGVRCALARGYEGKFVKPCKGPLSECTIMPLVVRRFAA